jgi:hypothetical protein
VNLSKARPQSKGKIFQSRIMDCGGKRSATPLSPARGFYFNPNSDFEPLIPAHLR